MAGIRYIVVVGGSYVGASSGLDVCVQHAVHLNSMFDILTGVSHLQESTPLRNLPMRSPAA